MIPLVLGPILFDETSLETPETLAAAVSARMAMRDYPGGLRTIQTFGVFPEPIKFRGKINRPDMLDRVQQLKALVAAMRPVAFTYGPLSWSGYVQTLTPSVLHQWRAEYEIVFVPQTDSGLSTQNDGTPSEEQVLGDQTTGLQDTTGATQSGAVDSSGDTITAGGYSFGEPYTAGASGIPTSAAGEALDNPLSAQGTGMGATPGVFIAGGVTFGPSYAAAPDGTPLPTQLVAPVGTLLGAVGNGMQAAGGVLAEIGTGAAATIAVAAQAAATMAAAVAGSPAVSAELAYAAVMIQARAAAIGGMVGAPASTQWTRNMVNPNLCLLATQYYGDASEWQTIAAANGLTDPQPLGQYQIIIPAA